MTKEKLYTPFKVENKLGFYCYKCETWHHKEVKFFYNVVVGEFSMASCRSCSLEYAEDISNAYNERHEAIKLMSVNPENPVMV